MGCQMNVRDSETIAGLLEEMGLPYQALEAAGVVSPVVGVHLEYKQPVRFADRVEVRVRVTAYSGVRLALAYEFYNRTAEVLSATATSAHCFLKAGRPVSLKRESQELDEKLGAYLEKRTEDGKRKTENGKLNNED